ncbi:unnamed protein product [Choristocarpus tenellus]
MGGWGWHGIVWTITTVATLLNGAVGEDFRYQSLESCDYTFAKGELPQFNLPNTEWGTTLLNDGNPIVNAADLTAIGNDCSGESASFSNGDGTWNSTFVGRYGTLYEFDFFSSTVDELFIGTVEPKHDPESFYATLNNTVIRLNIKCGDDSDVVGSCVEFTGNLAGYVQYPFESTCYHGFQSGVMAPTFRAPMASPFGPGEAYPMSSGNPIIKGGAIDEGLGWWAGFDGQDGNRLHNSYWSDWWSEAMSSLSEVDSSCSGGSAEYWNAKDGVWVSEFVTDDGSSFPLDMFHVQEVNGTAELWIDEIETWMAPSLYDQLQFNYVRLDMTCPSSPQPTSCVIFKPVFSNWSPRLVGDEVGFRFEYPELPSVKELPQAQPFSPGDLLVIEDRIVNKTGGEPPTVCNGDQAEYLGEDGYWRTNNFGSTAKTHALDHVFYTSSLGNVSQLWISTIQATWSPNLEATLMNRTVRLKISCVDRGDDIRTDYVAFQVGADPLTCEDIPLLCVENMETSNALSVMPRVGSWGGGRLVVGILTVSLAWLAAIRVL